MSALLQFLPQETPVSSVPASAATPLDQPWMGQPSVGAYHIHPWPFSPFVLPQVMVVDLALQGFKDPGTIFPQYSATLVPDEQFHVVEHPRQQEGIVRQPLAEPLNQETQSDPASKAFEQVYVLGNRRDILAFIKQNRVIEEFLLEARDPLNTAFGQESVKKLTLVEDDEGFVTLFCLILFPGGVQEARRALGSFDESWWLGHSDKVGGKLNFDFELI